MTVWGMDPVEIDVLATGLFCWEADSILAFINGRQRLEVIIVNGEGEIFSSDGWTNEIKWF